MTPDEIDDNLKLVNSLLEQTERHIADAVERFMEAKVLFKLIREALNDKPA